MFVISQILAKFFSLRYNLDNPNISQIFFSHPIFSDCRLGVYVCTFSKWHRHKTYRQTDERSAMCKKPLEAGLLKNKVSCHRGITQCSISFWTVLHWSSH